MPQSDSATILPSDSQVNSVLNDIQYVYCFAKFAKS